MADSDPKWNLDFVDSATKKEYEAFFKDHADQRHCKTTYERDVTSNPFFSPTELRIKKMEGEEWAGYYRFKKSKTKIIYYPHSPTHTIYTYETNTAINISYKKKSKK